MTDPVAAAGASRCGYGSFARTVRLPAGANEDDITATYADGILTVKVALGEAKAPARQINVQRTT